MTTFFTPTDRSDCADITDNNCFLNKQDFYEHNFGISKMGLTMFGALYTMTEICDFFTFQLSFWFLFSNLQIGLIVPISQIKIAFEYPRFLLTQFWNF